MKRIVAINASPRMQWNTGTLIGEAANGAKKSGADVEIIDLYKLGKYSGCISCFGCKLPEHQGVCIYQDALSPILEAIRNADGLIMGSPNYLGNVTSAFRALYERLIFQSITYKKEVESYNMHRIPVLLIMTSNAAKENYEMLGYSKVVSEYKETLTKYVGTTRVMISGNTLQVNDFDKYGWTMYDTEERKKRHTTVFPIEMEKAFDLGFNMVADPWE